MSDRFNLNFPKVHPEAVGSGIIKSSPKDFIVDEVLSFPFTQEGEHAYLKIKKTGQNTLWVINQLARHFGIKARDIGYAGLKDRYAVTTQWISLMARHVTDAKLASLAIDGIEILEVQHHRGKLRHGAIKCNNFIIQVNKFNVDKHAVAERLQALIKSGFPNYFDEQRFGSDRQNLVAVDKLFKRQIQPKKTVARIYISAARSWLFNLVLAARVKQGSWSTGLDGDIYMLNGSKRFFHEAEVSDVIQQRLADNDIHPTGPLWGVGEIQTTSRAKELEMQVLSGWVDWRFHLEEAGMKQQRRTTRTVPGNLQYQYDDVRHSLKLSFSLPAGAYATCLLREIGEIEDAHSIA